MTSADEAASLTLQDKGSMTLSDLDNLLFLSILGSDARGRSYPSVAWSSIDS